MQGGSTQEMPSFNGAATLSLRRLHTLAAAGARQDSFNGAATLSLRRPAARRRGCVARLRFNGAATLSLRRPTSGFCFTIGFINASMGPQLYRCGDRIWALVLKGRQKGFNGAATLSLRRLLCRRIFSHLTDSFNGAATLSLRRLGGGCDRSRAFSHASMGPQLYRCGDDV